MADRRESCRSCGAPIRWVLTQAGQWTMLDKEPNPSGIIALETEQDRGRRKAVVAVVLDVVSEETRYTSHRATCPNAEPVRR